MISPLKIRLFCALACLVFLSLVISHSSQAQEPNEQEKEINKVGYYLEAAPSAVFPVAGRKFLNLLYNVGLPYGDLRLGPGFQVAAGYDWEKFGFGAKFFMTNFGADPLGPGATNASGNFDNPALYGFDVEGRIFFMEFTDVDLQSFRPYALIGSGFGLIRGNTKAHKETYSGYEGNFGLGLQWQPVPYLNLGLESTYRPLLFGNECVATFPGVAPACEDADIHTISLSLNLGIRF